MRTERRKEGGMIRAGLTLTAALVALLAAMMLKDALVPLPQLPEAPRAGSFDARRAAERLARILGDERAHPVDSAANDAVRERLVAELRALGLQPRVTDDFACNGYGGGRNVTCARVGNVIATLGPPQGNYLLLSAHYDSTFAGPGAADDGIGVATLLEIAAQLRGRRISRPVALLFNEGEEMGLIGARAFLDADPLARRVEALLNFEARGVTGPAVMFETSRPNGAAIARFAGAAERPVANSLTTDLYRLIPNSTDVAVFEERPWTILNFAIIGNETRYHSAGDTLAALDRRSLQHMGDQGLALALDFATRAAPEPAGERLYLDLLGRQLIVLPMLFGLLLLAALLLFFAVTAWRRRALGRPLAAVVLGTVGSAGLAWTGQLVMSLVRSGDYWRGHPWVTELAVYAAAMAACLVALQLLAGGGERSRMRAAFWLAFLAAGAGLTAIAPGGAIYFLFPPLAAALGIALARRWRQAERIGAFAAILLLFLSFGPALALFEELMSGGPHWMFAPLGAAILMPALIELRPLVARIPPVFVYAGAGDLLLLPWAAVALTPAYAPDRQQLFTIDYVREEASGRTLWVVNNDGRPVPLDGQWRRETLPHSLRPRWVAPAPTISVGAPAVELVGQDMVGPGIRSRVRLRMNGAESVTLLAPRGTPMAAAGSPLSLQRVERAGRHELSAVRCVGRSCDGAVLDLILASPVAVTWTVVGMRTGLPSAGAALTRARPALARPQYAPDSTISIGRFTTPGREVLEPIID